jgi:hypothetical protein
MVLKREQIIKVSLLAAALTLVAFLAVYVLAFRYQQPNLANISPPTARYTFPGGGRQLLPDYRFIALYGSPGVPALGVLGEQPLRQTFDRIKKISKSHQKYTTTKVYPTLEIIATVASASPTKNGDYSREVEPAKLRPWVDAANKEGVYVVLDLQPGYSSFLKQAKQYIQLLKEPHVGLALDPEWRLRPKQTHLEQVGSVSASEVNKTSKWLAELASKHALPQKMLLIHQFRPSMITDRQKLNTAHDNLAFVIQMDGHGTQQEKLNSWGNIRKSAPKNVHFGWKNFYDEDSPMLTPKQTMKIKPQPWYVSYQ